MRKTFIWALLLLTGFSVDSRSSEIDVTWFETIRSGDMAAVHAALKRGADVNAAESDGTTALHWASYGDDVEMVSLLLSKGADVDAENRYGVRPLSLASMGGHSDTLVALLEAGADANLMTSGVPSIMYAARTGSVNAIHVLERYGADVNAKETLRGQTALMWAAADHHAAGVRALIDLGADVHARSDGGGFQRAGALEDVQMQVTKIEEGFTPVLFAARQGALEAVRVLAEAGADVNELAPKGSNVLLVAINNHHYELASFLVENGADPHATDKQGYTALHAAVQAETSRAYFGPALPSTGKMDRLTFIKFLVDQGVELDARLAPGTAREATTLDTIADRLIDYSVSLGGATPFFLAARFADVEVMRLLVAHGADPLIATEEQTTPLAVASGIGYNEGIRQAPDAQILDAIQLAMDFGNDPNLANRHGQTPLHGTVYRGLESAIQFLVEKGARLDAVDGVGRTPLKLAEEGYFLLASLLARDEEAVLLAQLSNDSPEAARLRRLDPTPGSGATRGTGTAASR